MSKNNYSSGLVAHSFWFVEFKKFVKLLHEGKSFEEIKNMCLEENLLGISKEYRAKRIYGYLKTRTEQLDDDLIRLFIDANLSTQKIINLIAIAKENKLFFEFLYEVYREKVIIGAIDLSDSDINVFLKNKQEQNEDVSKWTDVTLKRLRSTYMNFLTDAGLLSANGKIKSITPPILDESLEDYLKNKGEVQIFKAITGVS